jgi:putative membrane protein
MSDKFIFRFIIGISVFVFLVVVILNRKLIPVTIETPSFVYFLPKLNAFINGACSLLLIYSYYQIRYRKNLKVHKRVNIITFILSSLFLVSYIVFHYFVKETTYGGEGLIKSIYYFILVTHIVLAAVVLPLILFSFQRGLQMQVEKHRKLVRWSFPIWLYVTVTGVIVYLMISPYYSF